MIRFNMLDGKLKYEVGGYAEPDGLMEIVFDEFWAKQTGIAAVFRRSGGKEEYIVPIHRNHCHVPYELLALGKSFQVCLRSKNAATEFAEVPEEAAGFNMSKYTVPILEKVKNSVRENTQNIEWLEDNMPKDTVGKTEFDETVDEIKTELAETAEEIKTEIAQTAEEIKQGDFGESKLKAKSLITTNSISVPEIKNVFETDSEKKTASIRETETCIGLKYTSTVDSADTLSELQVSPAKITLKANDEIIVGNNVTPKIRISGTEQIKLSAADYDRLVADETAVNIKAPSVVIKSENGNSEIADFKQNSIEIRTFDENNEVASRLYFDDDAKIQSKNAGVMGTSMAYLDTSYNSFSLDSTGIHINIKKPADKYETHINSFSLIYLLKEIYKALEDKITIN